MPPEENTLDDAIISISIEAGSTIRVKIDGRSMLPLVRRGDVLGIRPDRRGIKKGDIILFRSSGRMVAHRVININNGTITTKGDALTIFDLPIQRQDIIGRAVFIESRGRRTDLNTCIWRALNHMLACYSYACGSIFGKIFRKIPNGRIAEYRYVPNITGAVNMLLPMSVYIFTRRL